MQPTLSDRVRFGSFELDLRAGELRGNSETVVLPEQQFQVLRLLVEHAGVIVTREEIKKKLWPNDTVVEFDHGINNTIKNLRRVFSDSADSPQYIETVARRGYRLVMSVEWVKAADDLSQQSQPVEAAPEMPEFKVGSLTGKTVSHYRVLEIIGGGGMGMVYRAEDLKLGRAVALKFLPEELSNDPQALARFGREARAVSALSHPNICPIYEFDEYAGQPFIVMELLHGKTLRDHLADGAFRLYDPAGLDIAIQAASGLEAAHEQGVIHRDIKPANIFITEKNGAKILDFGVAKVLASGEGLEAAPAVNQRELPLKSLVTNLTRTGLKLGTAGYMSPEQIRGEALDTRTDIFSFGLVMYEMATGERAFSGETETIQQEAILTHDPKPVRGLASEISPQLETIITKCLQKDRAQRYQAAEELAVDLRRLSVPSLTQQVRHPGPPWKNWALATIAASVVIAAVVFSLDFGGLRIKLLSRSAAQQQIRSLAVLPLTSLSGDKEQDYFTEGMTEALITELGSMSALRVISHQSVMQYKGTTKSVQQIARELNVEAIVEGSIIRAGNQVRVSVRLIDGRTDRHLWVANYQREMRGILSLQTDVAKTIANEVRVKLTPQEEKLLASARPVTPEAHEAYLKGLYYVNRWPEPESVHCIESFQRAIEIEPTLADAQAGLATCYTVMPWSYPPKEVFPRAKAAATEALRLDANQGEAYAALGAVNMFFEWDWGSAEQNLRRAVELNPNRALSRGWYSNYFLFLGRSEEAIREAKAAVQLDPASIITNRNLAFVYLLSHKYPEYAAQAQATLELAPSDENAHWDLALALALQGKRNEAVEQLKAGVLPIDRAVVLAVLGDKELALKALKEAGPPRSPITAAYANAYAPLGERDTAIRLLEQAYDERDAEMVQLYSHPALDSLHSDPRFQALLRRMNFPQ